MTNSSLIIICISLLAAIFSSCETSQELTVMTYNIRYDNERDSINKWNNRKERVTTLISEQAPDIFGIQEGLIQQVRYLDEHLPSYSRCGVGRDDGKEKGEFSALFYNKDKYVLGDCQTFWLSETPTQPGPGWDANLNRVVSWASLTHKESGREMFFFNTHFDHRGEEARRESANLIIRKIQEIAGDAPIILTGDFNADPQSVPYKTLVQDSTLLRDAFIQANEKVNESSGTYASAFHEDNLSDRRIDHVFVSTHFEVLRHEIINTKQGSYYPSDHLPVKSMLRY